MNTYYWSTEESHADNNETMRDYLENEIHENVNVLFVEGTYAEVETDGMIYEVHVSGNGDFNNHKAELIELACVRDKSKDLYD